MNIKLSKKITYELFIALALVDTVIYITEKLAVVHSSGIGIMFYVNIFLQFWIWVGLFLAILQLLLWLKILNKNDLSLAYPITSLSTPSTMLIAQFVFNEHLSIQVWVGTLLISLGIILISRKEHKTDREIIDSNSESVCEM